MPHPRSRFLLIAATLAPLSGVLSGQPPSLPPLPMAVSNNTVAAGMVKDRWTVFSFLGIDSTRRWSGITRRGFAYDDTRRDWRALPDVPGSKGRLAATAQFVRGRIYLFGGYTVDSAGNEHSVDAVDIFDPATNSWTRGQPMPTAVDDAVSGVYHDSLIYLISGWHERDNVRAVQAYDIVADRWHDATSIPGPGVFGHSGAISGNSIVYIDGVTRNEQLPRFRLATQSWLGTINREHPESITWRQLAAHPGPARYRSAAGSCGPLIVFAGGTDNPYNYNGKGYNGVPSSPLATIVAFNVRTMTWLQLPSAPIPTMDHRGLITREGRAAIVGGMRTRQQVSSGVVEWALDECR